MATMYEIEGMGEVIFTPIEKKPKRIVSYTEEWKKHLSESHKGSHLSEETKRKIGLKSKGRKMSNETKRKIGESRRGKKRPPHVIAALIASHLGKHPSEETRRKMSESHKGLEPRSGYKLSLETKEKLRLANTGRRPSEETRERMRKAHKGKKFSAEAHEKARQINMGNKYWVGRKHTEEAKKKMSESQKKNKESIDRLHRLIKPSKIQLELFEVIKKLYPNKNVITEQRVEGTNFSIDVAIPELMLGFEWDEPYWHQDKEKDIKRHQIIESFGWKILHYTNKKELEELKRCLNSTPPNII